MAISKAALRIRLKSGCAVLTALRGDLSEVEAVHALLCNTTRKAQKGQYLALQPFCHRRQAHQYRIGIMAGFQPKFGATVIN